MRILVPHMVDWLNIVPGFQSGALLDPLRQWYLGLLARLQELIAAIDLPVLKYYSYLIEEALRKSGGRLLSDHLVWILLGLSLAVGIPACMVLWRILWTGMRLDKSAFAKVDKGRPGVVATAQGGVLIYLKSAANLAVEGVLLVLVATVVSIVVYIYCKICWYAYLASPIGQYYPVYFPERAGLMNMVLGRDLFIFPGVLTLVALMVALPAAAVCRLLHVTRYAYFSRGLTGKVFLFGLPLAALAAFVVQAVFAIPAWTAAFASVLLPMLLVFSYCFKVTHRLLPEVGLLVSLGMRNRQVSSNVVFLQDLNSGQKTLEFDPIQAKCTGRHYPAADGIVTQGMFFTRRGHDFILYRYGRDLFFQMDEWELRLQPEMVAHRADQGRYRHRFQLTDDQNCIFRILWRIDFIFGHRTATTAFFDTFQEILENQEAFEDAFVAQWDPEEEEEPAE